MIDSPVPMPPNLPGLESEWSDTVVITDRDGRQLGIHVLDVGPKNADLTVVCVHGNPTWSYLWRTLIAAAPPDVRVLAVDQVGMGYSARVDRPRRLAQRVEDLGRIVEAANVVGRVVVVAHDWGGPIALGWVQRAMRDPRYRIEGVVLANTAVHQPQHRGTPALIAAARTPGLLATVTGRTPVFVRGTTAISSVDAATARAFAAPYRHRSDRHAITDFVADIPLEPDHPSRPTLDAIADGMAHLVDTRTLLVWGMRDPVFSPRYLDDLRRRLPHADVQQYDDAGHLVLEDRLDAVKDIWRWIGDLGRMDAKSHGTEPVDLLVNLRRRASDAQGTSRTNAAVTEPVANTWRSVSWQLLDDRVGSLAVGFSRRGVRPGDRVALLLPPGTDLLAVVYALWSIGATIVVIDAANGPRALWRSLRAARLDHVVAIRRARPVVAALKVPGIVVWSDELSALARQVRERHIRDSHIDETVDAGTDAAIVFTSGATGPAKPVAYTRERIAATRDVLLAHYGFTSEDVLVAAFAPWAVLGPLLGIASVIPRMDASRPGSLTAEALAESMERAGGTVMWMSPAALRSVLSGSREGTDTRRRVAAAGANLRYLLLAGAPVSRKLLAEAMRLWPNAQVRTPYGMTEVLPATDVLAQEVLHAQEGWGVLVGRPLPGVDVAIAPLGEVGTPAEELTDRSGVLGEVAIRARHAKSRYDGRVFVERQSGRNPGWHRTGDIGILDEQGRLWIEGRLSHVITTATGPVGPVSIEQRVEGALVDAPEGPMTVAAVGVGPRGSQVIAIVCAPNGGSSSRSRSTRLSLASTDLVERVNTVAPDAAAVLWCERLPVDIRHGAKIDRVRLAQAASDLLAGRS